MPGSKIAEIHLSLNRQGASSYAKTSYPIRYGRYHELRYGDYLVQCNLRGEVKYIMSRHADWPHPSEWLKRSEGGNWIYYSTGGYYSGVFDLLGEYYLPCLGYPSNNLSSENPFSLHAVKRALATSEELTVRADYALSIAAASKRKVEERQFLRHLACTGGNYYSRKKERLDSILGAEISVLPPDSRHVDYEVVPLIIADGCLYHCDFCSVKADRGFRRRSRSDIGRQLRGVVEYYGADLVNCNSLFLGQLDSLAANNDDILYAASEAYRILNFPKSLLRQPRLFLFGSVGAILEKDESFWAALDKLPFTSFINLGLESFDRQTLSLLGKPLSPEMVEASFQRALQVNRRFPNIEISVNVVLGENLPTGHRSSLQEFLGKPSADGWGKMTVYCSPLCGSADNRKSLLAQFRQLKRQSSYDIWLYLIQRL